MNLGELRQIVNSIPASCDNYGVIALDRLKAEANGYYTVSVPIHGVAVDCHDGSIIVVDEEQATVIRVVGKVPVSNPAPSRKVLLD